MDLTKILELPVKLGLSSEEAISLYDREEKRLRDERAQACEERREERREEEEREIRRIECKKEFILRQQRTLKGGLCGNWIEIAYGTSAGAVRVIVQHPETVGHGPQLFQTFTVHRSPVTRVVLSEKYLISVCSEYSHVRTWSVTRFRGMISTQPGSTPLASFKVVSLEDLEPSASYPAGNDCGERYFFIHRFLLN
ncbi:hypothetical protein HPB52_002793 [Rhipicephalus sanguineus]|uniref:Uncharacterized protein n=1 Tax=Rhipicephalus sanguineus TaxID=34632 RepID=A0A9D4Q9J7_RHISA|nr:hypothetical protein HPB52_002793 [Rhipicephalus sanguineus]